jgi:type IV pilus assembly protein PilE
MNRYKFLAKNRGVTLMELMIVVVVASILASISVPSYRRYLLRSQRAEAKIALLQLQTAEEKHYLQFNAYTATPGLGLLNVTETNKYDISVVLGDATAQSYTATATPRAGGGQADDAECANFTITDHGTRGVSGSDGTQTCWK